jgi:hypothetical protein
MMAESLPILLLIISIETGEKALDTRSSFLPHFLIAGIRRVPNPRSSVILDSPIATKEMTTLRLLVRTTNEGNCQQQCERNNNFLRG